MTDPTVEAVAWMYDHPQYQHLGFDGRVVIFKKSSEDVLGEGWTETPLYTSDAIQAAVAANTAAIVKMVTKDFGRLAYSQDLIEAIEGIIYKGTKDENETDT